MFFNKRTLKLTAGFLLLVMSYEMVYPTTALALTSGPSQPEVQGFEPVGTTDMVDLFTGDFMYNIPLLDVEGYPVNISYHGGVNMDQEASWVGLGWNINPGEINRTVRGVPDDFNGDTLKKALNIKDEKNFTVGVQGNIEPFGSGPPRTSLSISVGGNLNVSNYRGASVNLTGGINANLFGFISAGANVGVGSQTGADINYNAGLQIASSQIINSNLVAGGGMGYNAGYNTRSGLATRSFSVSTNVSAGGVSVGGPGVTVPIGGINNIVPVITNSSVMNSIAGSIRLGAELFGIFGSIGVNGRMSILEYEKDGSRPAYGYLNYENSSEDDILDFTRDKDGFFNRSMRNLPPGNLAYDIYSVNGQGTGGSFRPFRNDFGSVFDPVTKSKTKDGKRSGEFGIGNLFSAGYDETGSTTTVTTGPWEEYRKRFRGLAPGSMYEPTYFKQAGELTLVNGNYYSSIGGESPVTNAKSLPFAKSNAYSDRDARANHISYFTAREATIFGVASDTCLYSYSSSNGFKDGFPDTSKKEYIPRINRATKLGKKPHHISEIVQVQTNGKRFVYGLPAMNMIQKEATFTVGAPTNDNDKKRSLVPYNIGVDDSKSNNKGMDNYYSATYTPSYAHSYLLTSVLSVDYVDVKGDGPTDDDLGNFHKFNYTRKESDYRWKAPIDSGKAQYNPGFRSDKRDDKASYMIGSREQWMLHSIETKNYVAEFYTSKRLDAKGIKDAISPSEEGYAEAPYSSALSEAGSSYKLDSIVLFNKHDRFINKEDAVPVKSIYFTYDYSLCKKVPNVDVSAVDTGKLTLKQIHVKYGTSDKSLLSPYQFQYSSFNPDYDPATKDRWGAFKPNNPTFNNADYPYTNQASDSLDIYASAWSLETIHLPSGGAIHVDYEADDYAYVQNQRAMEMFMLEGVHLSTNFYPGSELMYPFKQPALYAYFKRRPQDEDYRVSFRDRYFKDQENIYYNFSVRLVDDLYEPVKGYGKVLDVGICKTDTSYGYVKFEGKNIEGGGKIHPATYTALNIGRYNLPHILYPGSNPDESDLVNVMKGLWDALKSLLTFYRNPFLNLLDQGKGRSVDLDKSYIRLCSPSGHKKGGGQRVKSMQFYDNWSDLAGGNVHDATYGKDYDYTIQDNGGYSREISSGVASYEPQIGGDENPFRTPQPYKVQDKSNFPPSDPVELYQETPIGETFFPSPVVGYSKVTARSIHRETGRSSQGVDISEFYTARDFPIRVNQTPINELEKKNSYKFKEQRVVLKVSQGYTIVLNDMHGKPKKTEHRVVLPKNASSNLISYQIYKYNTSGGGLNNYVNTVSYDPSARKMVSGSQLLGQEIDVTVDCREKIEETISHSMYFSSNGFIIPLAFFPLFILLPRPTPWDGNYLNQFNSVVSTKVIQQYGILSEVENYEEGTITTVRNEAYDPLSGQPVLTSVNNEFEDKEYTMNYPAYWGYKEMGPAYVNTGYTDSFAKIVPYGVFTGTSGGTYLLPTPTSRAHYYHYGDELLVKAVHPSGGAPKIFTAWVCGYAVGPVLHCQLPSCFYPVITIRNRASGYLSGLSDTLSAASIKIIRSAYKNQLNESMQSLTSSSSVFDDTGTLKTSFSKLINIKAQEYAAGANATLSRPTADSLNDFVNGNYRVHRLYKEYTYLAARDYKGSSVRRAGTFNATSLWETIPRIYLNCEGVICDTASGINPNSRRSGIFWASYMQSNQKADANWKTARTITKWTPWGMEAENLDALGHYTSAVFRYNHQLPVAVAQNARQSELTSENFEDMGLLQALHSWIPYEFSPFVHFFGSPDQLDGSSLGVYDLTGGSSYAEIVTTTAHTGVSSLKIKAANDGPTGTFLFSLPVKADMLPMMFPPLDHPGVIESKKYILSYWFKPVSTSSTATQYAFPTVDVIPGYLTMIRKSNIIDGWQQIEIVFPAPSISSGTLDIRLPTNIYIDDLRIFPIDGNMKSFVYHPFNQRLMATLDENNYATFYEYDQEGNLIRTKRETERGIITLSESRSANPKQ